MTEEEAERVLRIMAEADGGCPVCARELYIKFVKSFPQHKDLAKRIFLEIFEADLCKRDEDIEHAHRTNVYDFSEDIQA